jgi:nucleoid DNA-binding protein
MTMSNKLRHSDLVSQTFQTLLKDKTFKHSLTKTEVSQAIDTYLEIIEECLLKGDNVTLKNIGVLETFKSTRTEVINPATQQKLTIPKRTKARLRVNKNLKKELANGK